MTDIVAFIHARLDEDEAVARGALGTRGRQTGATVQHWLWELRGPTEIVLTDGSAPVDPAHCYSEDIAPGSVEGTAILCSRERYPATVADWQLPDRLLPAVEEPRAGAAQHIARHDPARVLRQVAVLRELFERALPERECRGHPRPWMPHGDYGPGYCHTPDEADSLRVIAAIWSDHRDYRPEWAAAGQEDES